MKIVNTDDFDKATHWIPTDKDSTKFNVTIGKQYKLFYDAQKKNITFMMMPEICRWHICVSQAIQRKRRINIIKIIEIPKSQLVSKIDAEPVPLNYEPKEGEHIITAYLWGFAPIKYKSKTITQKMFDKMCN